MRWEITMDSIINLQKKIGIAFVLFLLFTLGQLIDFANNILASHKYDNNASVTDLIKFKIF